MKKILWIWVFFSFSCLQACCFEGKVDSSFSTKDEGFCLGVIEKKEEESALYKGFCLEGFSQIELYNTNNPKVLNFVLYKNKHPALLFEPPKPDTKNLF
ncbi:hypothetical protein [Helicobacter suis]|uniref:hypothetical protein n=1 Tax=Helicobacter suis TaxID=104628 RepID=UPI0013D7B337|nr:hypothetical protein [Helicobacter suis]